MRGAPPSSYICHLLCRDAPQPSLRVVLRLLGLAPALAALCLPHSHVPISMTPAAWPRWHDPAISSHQHDPSSSLPEVYSNALGNGWGDQSIASGETRFRRALIINPRALGKTSALFGFEE